MSAADMGTIVLTTVVVIVLSGTYYAVLGAAMARLSPAYAGPQRSPGATPAVELVRSLVVVVATATLVAALALDGVGHGLGLALALWVAFPVVLLTGSVFHERVPPLLAAIHAGDWPIRLAVVATIITARR